MPHPRGGSPGRGYEGTFVVPASRQRLRFPRGARMARSRAWPPRPRSPRLATLQMCAQASACSPSAGRRPREPPQVVDLAQASRSPALSRCPVSANGDAHRRASIPGAHRIKELPTPRTRPSARTDSGRRTSTGCEGAVEFPRVLRQQASEQSANSRPTRANDRQECPEVRPSPPDQTGSSWNSRLTRSARRFACVVSSIRSSS